MSRIIIATGFSIPIIQAPVGTALESQRPHRFLPRVVWERIVALARVWYKRADKKRIATDVIEGNTVFKNTNVESKNERLIKRVGLRQTCLFEFRPDTRCSI